MCHGKPLIIELKEGSKHQPLLDKPESCGMRSGRVLLNAGKECSRHTTGSNEELLVFLSGRGEVVLENETLPAGAGQVAYIPPETIHSVRNTQKSGPLVYVYCVAPVHTTPEGQK